MPTYDYLCQECEHEMECFQKITEDPLKTCPKCGKNALNRIPGGGIGLSFKGSGFYITDYGAKKGSESESTSKQESPSSDTSSCPCGSKSPCSS